MAQKFSTLDFMPGVYRPATKLAAKGRWYDTQLVRWRESGPAPVMQPWGGWVSHIAPFNGMTGILDGNPIQGMMSFRTSEDFPGYGLSDKVAVWIGTEDNVYMHLVDPTNVYTNTANRTPSSYVGGPIEETISAATITRQNFWQFDLFIQDGEVPWPVGIAQSDQVLFYWQGLSDAGAAVIDENLDNVTGRSVVVTPERFVVVLGASGNERLVRWCDQEDITTWVAAVDNQAGSFPLQTKGVLMCGRASRKETLLWTDQDLWGMEYIGGTLVYGFHQRGNNCGTISARAVAMKDSGAVWMGRDSFFIYDGFVRPLPCPVADFVFGRYTEEELPAGAGINRQQRDKVAAVHNPDFFEVTWFYPSANSEENDRYVTYNYVLDIWTIGAIPRTDGCHTIIGPMLGAFDGHVYLHEQYGENWEDADETQYTPSAESGPIELGDGDRVMHLLEYIPDEQNLGRASIAFKTSMEPTGAETTTNVTVAARSDMRVVGRFARLVVTTTTQGDMWRMGKPKLDIRAGGYR